MLAVLANRPPDSIWQVEKERRQIAVGAPTRLDWYLHNRVAFAHFLR